MRSSYAICIKYFNWTVTLKQFSYRENILWGWCQAPPNCYLPETSVAITIVLVATIVSIKIVKVEWNNWWCLAGYVVTRGQYLVGGWWSIKMKWFVTWSWVNHQGVCGFKNRSIIIIQGGQQPGGSSITVKCLWLDGGEEELYRVADWQRPKSLLVPFAVIMVNMWTGGRLQWQL